MKIEINIFEMKLLVNIQIGKENMVSVKYYNVWNVLVYIKVYFLKYEIYFFEYE